MKNVMRKLSVSLASALLLSGVALTATAAQSSSFEALDTDADGYISMEEAHAGKILTEAFEAADSNKDNRLDKAEFSMIAAE